MRINAKPPQFVPQEYRAEIEKLSKAALMDLAWDFATQLAATDEQDSEAIMNRFREGREVVLAYRD